MQSNRKQEPQNAHLYKYYTRQPTPEYRFTQMLYMYVKQNQ